MGKMLRNYCRNIVAMVMLFATTALAAAQDKSTWEDIQSRGTLRMGVTQAVPWFSKNPATEEWDSGVMLSLGKRLAADLGVELEPVEVTWATSIAALQSGKIDFAFLEPTPERAKAVDFTLQPMLYISMAVLARDGLTVEKWSDLDKPEIKVAVPQASSMEAFLTETIPNADIQRFPDNAAAIAAYQSGRVDGVSLFHPPLLAARKKMQSGSLVIPTPSFSSPSAFAVRREADKTFRDWLSTAVFFYYETGQTQKLYEEFLVGFGLDPKASPVIQKELMYKQ